MSDYPFYPEEVPYREVPHQPFPADDEPPEHAFWPAHLGRADTDLSWPRPTEAELKRWRKEIRERESRRRPLGFAPWT